MNNNIEYGLFENVIDSYYLDCQIRDDFQCTKLVTHMTPQQVQCIQIHPVHTHMIIFQLDSLADSTQQQTLYTNEADALLFTTDTATQCAFNIIPSNLDTESTNDVHSHSDNNTGILFYSKHKYRDTFGDARIIRHCRVPTCSRHFSILFGALNLVRVGCFSLRHLGSWTVSIIYIITIICRFCHWSFLVLPSLSALSLF